MQLSLTLICVLDRDNDAPPEDLRRNMMKLTCKCYVSAHRHVLVQERVLLLPSLFILLASTTNTGGNAQVALRNMMQICSSTV